MGKLTVHLWKVDHLCDDDLLGKSDPYVKLELEQDNMVFDKDYGDKQSEKKKNELNPEYNQDFHFSDIPSLENMVLKVKIMDDDIGRDEELGSCKIKLEDLGLSSSPIDVEKVVDRKLFRSNATIYLKLSYSEYE